MLSVLLAIASVGACAAVVAGERGRRLSLARALHELRGALASLQLGAGSPIAALERAQRAVTELESLRRYRRPRSMPRQAVPVDWFVRRIVSAHKPSAEKLGRRLEYLPGAPSARVWADRGALNQALTNLIVNALEHGHGKIGVYTGRAAAEVLIAITDEGAGRAVVPRPRGLRRRWGTIGNRGHGLAIARATVEAHGGTLTVGRSDALSSFTIRLPVTDAQLAHVA